MEKEILCKTLAEAFTYIEQNMEEDVVYTIEMVPAGTKKVEVADES